MNICRNLGFFGCGGRLIAAIAAVLTCLSASGAAEGLPALRRIDVPAAHPELWATNPGLIAVPRREFERLLEAAQPTVKSSQKSAVTSAVYEATLLEHALTGGRLRLTIQRDGNVPLWQRLAPWNVAVSGISWSDREAVAGTAPDGQFWLWTDRAQGEVVGGWSARGTAVGDRTEFELHLPEALNTQLRLRTPSGSKLIAENGLARQVEPDMGSGWELWEAEPADPAMFRFRVLSPPVEARTQPLIAFRQQLAAEVREDHLRFQARFDAEVWGGDIADLTFSIPSSVELYAVTLGTETSLEWNREATPGPRHTVRVQLPEPARGAMRPIVLEGVIGSRAGASTSIPQVELVNGLFQSGQQTVTVMRPMQIAAIKSLTGCRLGAPLISAPDRETLTVEQLLPGALLTLDLRRPTSALTAQVLSCVDLQEETWRQTAHVLWTVSSGSVFQAACRLPANWDITAVDAFNTTRGAERISWEKVDESGGGALLRLEFFQAIAPNQPRLLQIQMRHRTDSSVSELSCPIPVPQDCTVQDAVLALNAEHRFRASIVGETVFSEIAAGDVAAGWWRQSDWNGRIDPGTNSIWFRGADVGRFGSLHLEPEPASVTCRAVTRVDLSASSGDASASAMPLGEQYRLELRPKSQPCDRILVWLSEPGPDVSWQVESPPGTQLISRRLGAEQIPLWGLPPDGDLWEIRVPPIEDEDLVLTGERLRTQAVPGSAGLAFVPQAETFAGTIEFRAADTLPVDVIPHGLVSVSSDSKSGVRVWQYNSLDDELRWVSHAAPRVQSSTLARLELRTLVSAPDEPFDYHRATCILPPHSETLQFYFPENCEPLSAVLDGIDLGRVGEAPQSVPPARGSEPQRLTLSYRTRCQRGFLLCSRTVPSPICRDVVWTGFRWEFSLPPTTRLWSEPTGVRLADPLAPAPWTERLFGPFGRPITESIFWPWSSTSWAALVKPSPLSEDATTVSDPEWRVPAGWATHLAYAPEPPASLQFSLWRGDRIQLLAWIGVLASVILGINLRRAGRSYRDPASVLALATLVAIAGLADPPVTELIGGIWTGTLFAMLVPRRWFEPAAAPTRRTGSVGSTGSFTIPPLGSAATMVVLTVGLAFAADQPSLTLPGENVVLVPVDANGVPSEKLPLVYTTPEVMRTLRDTADRHAPSNDPTWLFERAVYRVKLTHESPAVIFAAFDVAVAGPEKVVTVPLPLRGSGLSSVASCRVDGRPAVLTARPELGGFQVVIARPDFPVSAIGELPLTRHTIMVEMYRPWQADGNGAGVSFRIPTIHGTRCVVEGLSGNQTVRFPAALGETQSRDSNAGSMAEFGPVDDLQVHWTLSNSGARHAPAECEIESAELLVVSPNALQSRTRTVLSPQSGTLRRFTMKLPPRAVLQDVQAVPPTGYQVRQSAADSQAVHFEFAGETRQPVTLRCQYIIPRQSPGQEFIWNPLAWSSPDAIVWTTRERVLAISSTADLRVQPQSVEDSGLAPLSLTSARELLDELIADLRPREVYQVGGDRPIPFRSTTVVPQRRLSTWQQQGVFRKDRLTWTMEAVIEAPTAPIYAHQLTFDRQLKIESILVRERNADRALPWREVRQVGNSTRVTVFLTDPMTESQTITVVGSLPISGGSMALPNVRVENAEYQKGRLEISADPAWQLDWHGVRGLKRFFKAADSQSAAASTWEYDVQDPEWRASVRLRPFDENAAVRAVHVLVHPSADDVELHSRVDVPALDRGMRLVLDLPRPWQLQHATQISGVQIEPGENATRIVLPSETSSPITLRWQARAAWSEFPPGECPLPEWQGLGRHELRTWIAEIVTPPLVPRLQMSTASESRSPPAWAEQWIAELVPMSPTPRWVGQLPESSSQWPFVPPETPAEPAHIAWLEHRLWREGSDRDAGSSLIQLAKPVRQLSMLVPPGIQVSAVLIDGELGSLLAVDKEQHRLSSADGQTFQEARVLWHSRGFVPAAWSGLVETQWPTFPHAQIEQQAVTVFPAANEAYWPLRGWSHSDAVDRILQRLESLCDEVDAAHPADHWTESRLQNAYAIALSKLSRHVDAIDERHPDRKERWQAIRERVQRLQRGSSLPPGSNVALMDELLADHPAAKYGLVNPAAERTWSWRINFRMLRLLGVCVLFLAMMVMLRRLMRPAWRDWLRAHPNGAVGLIGFVWWLCLTPSIFGFAVLAWAVYRALTAPRVLDSPGTATA